MGAQAGRFGPARRAARCDRTAALGGLPARRGPRAVPGRVRAGEDRARPVHRPAPGGRALRPDLRPVRRAARQAGHRGRGRRGQAVEHSVAHSGDLVAVAVARTPVGVDVEQLDGRPHPLGGDGDPEALARLVLSAAERAALAAVPPAGRARAFLVAWTRKEAVTKATGDGLRAAFSDVVVAADAGPPRLVSWPYERSVAQRVPARPGRGPRVRGGARGHRPLRGGAGQGRVGVARGPGLRPGKVGCICGVLCPRRARVL